MSNNNLIATYEVRAGDGETVSMTGNPEKLDKIVQQMQAHSRLIGLLKECADYIKRVSEATHDKGKIDFANYDLLDAVETAVDNTEETPISEARPLYLCSDGWIHLERHKPVMQRLDIPMPLGFVLSERCTECGTASEYEAAVKERAKSND